MTTLPNQKQAAQKKVALDSEAEKYWSDYYKDSGYGKQWTRSIPKRVQAALLNAAAKKSAGKTAAQAERRIPVLQPLATVVTEKGVHLEGLAIYGSGKERAVKAFVADFNHDGVINGFATVDAQ